MTTTPPETPTPKAGPTLRYSAAAVCAGLLLVAIFTALVIWFRADLRNQIHLKIIERDAAVLYPMALQQVEEGEDGKAAQDAPSPLTALLKSARQNGMLAVAIFDADGNTLESVPSTQLFVELPTDDFLTLQGGVPISRYHPQFPLDQYFAGVSSPRGTARPPSSRSCSPSPARSRSQSAGLSGTSSTPGPFRGSSRTSMGGSTARPPSPSSWARSSSRRS